MAGCYASTRDGRAQVRIAKGRDGYAFALRQGNEWTKPAPMQSAGSQELVSWFGADTASIAEGLTVAGSPFGVFRLKPDGRIRGMDSTARYAMPWKGNGSAFRVECR